MGFEYAKMCIFIIDYVAKMCVFIIEYAVKMC